MSVRRRIDTARRNLCGTPREREARRMVRERPYSDTAMRPPTGLSRSEKETCSSTGMSTRSTAERSRFFLEKSSNIGISVTNILVEARGGGRCAETQQHIWVRFGLVLRLREAYVPVSEGFIPRQGCSSGRGPGPSCGGG